MHGGRESTRGVACDTERVLAVLEGMVPRSRAVGSARVTCVGALGRRARSRAELGRLLVDGLLCFLRGERTRRDGRGRVDGLAEVEVGRGGGGFRGFGEVGGWACARVKGLEALGRIERDAEMAREGWAEGSRAGFRVDLGKGRC